MSIDPRPTWTETLTEREIEILILLEDGFSNREIAQKLYLSLNTIKWYNKQIFAKLGVRSRTQAVKAARQHQLLPGQTSARQGEATRPLHNLPAQWTSYVGRAKELAELQELLTDSRLVTLTGAGGTGKTRLALEVAGFLRNHYQRGVWLVELATLTDPASVTYAIAQVLKVRADGYTSLIEALKRSLDRKHLLLLLDNFEHVLQAAPLVTELLASASQLTVLATSRERLGL
jgi:ATP/maltotriose-dependent transcriptional regulator MalT